jgi:DNA-binding CsgD family transcriptional regulator
MSPVTPAEDARTIMLNRVSWGAVLAGGFLGGHATLYQGELPDAIALLERACADFRAIGNPLGEFDTLILLTAATFFLEDPRVHEYSRQALALADRHGALSSKAYGLWSVGIAQWRAGRYGKATRSLRDCVRLFLPMHDLTGISFGVQALSWCAAFDSPDERAALLLGGSQAVWRTSGAKVGETNAYSLFDKRSQDVVREALGPDRFEQAFAEGAAYSFEQAVSLALGEVGEADESHSTAVFTRRKASAPGGLTRREREIAGLLAEGLTNREIAARLVISQRTAETHVDHILRKLGMTSRTQVANWVIEQQAR